MKKLKYKNFIVAVLVALTLFMSFALSGCAGDGEPSVEPTPEPSIFKVTYSIGDNGYLDGRGTQAIASGGDAESVTAIPKRGYEFKDWSDGVKTPQRQDKNVNDNLKVTANFIIRSYTVTYNVVGPGKIIGNATQTVAFGGETESVTVEITDMNYQFKGWTDGVKDLTRNNIEITDNINMVAIIGIKYFTASYKAGEGGSIEGTATQKTPLGNKTNTVKAIADEDYEFVKWSDGETSYFRQDNVPQDFEVTALFKKKVYDVKYTANPGGIIEGSTEQTIYYNKTASAVTAVPNEGYEFLSWSDGVMTPSRQDDRVKTNISARATFAPIGQTTFEVFMVFVTEVHAELETYEGEVIKVDYVMSQVERQIMELSSAKMQAKLNDIFAGKVKFKLINYFTTQPLGTENVRRGLMTPQIYEYSIDMRTIPEIKGIYEKYRSGLVTYNLNDYAGKLHFSSGSAGAKYGNIHMEGIIQKYKEDNSLIEVPDITELWVQKIYNFSNSTFLHEFTHTVEPHLGMLHQAIGHYMDLGHIVHDEMEIIEMYLKNEFDLSGEMVGVPFEFWQNK